MFSAKSRKAPLFLVFVASLAISFLLAEIAVRFFLPVYNPWGAVQFYEMSDGIPRGKPGLRRHWKNTGDFDVRVHFNSDGLRDAKDFRNATPGDWFVIGDSFSFGWGVEEGERYSNLLETRLGRPFYNLSTTPADLNTYEQLARFAAESSATIGNLIIAVCMENDLDLYTPPEEGGPPNGLSFPGLKDWLTSHSALYNLTTHVVHGVPFFERIAVRSNLITENDAGISLNAFDEAMLESSAKKLAAITGPFKAYVVLIPSRALWTGTHREIERRVHERFLQKLNDLQIKVIDLRPIFEEGGDPLKYHFKNDPHWTKGGHLKAAEAIAQVIESGPA